MGADDRRIAIRAGAAAGLAGVLAFLVVHHVIIRPIWGVAPIGAIIAMVGGAAVGSAYQELRGRLPPRPRTAPAAMAGAALVLAPAFALAQLRGPVFAMRAGDAVLVVPATDVVWAFVVELLGSAALVGLILGWVVGRTRRAATSTAVAALGFAVGAGHNVPFLGGTSGVPKELLLIGVAVVVASIVLVEVDARTARPVRLVPDGPMTPPRSFR